MSEPNEPSASHVTITAHPIGCLLYAGGAVGLIYAIYRAAIWFGFSFAIGW